MCGIVGYAGQRHTTTVLLDALGRLEYRGYDSAGVAVHDGRNVRVLRAVGNLQALRQTIEHEWECRGAVVTAEAVTTVGIAHTRWATHGAVTTANAHPHTDCTERVHVVLNGIIENHLELRRQLAARGCTFTSETDAEPIAHLVERFLAKGEPLERAVRSACSRLEGHFAIVVVDRAAPSRLVAARRDCPLVVGLGSAETFVASSAAAFRPYTDRMVPVPDGAVASITCDGLRMVDAVSGAPLTAVEQRLAWTTAEIEKGTYSTFMRKEIHDQPAALDATLAEIRGADPRVPDLAERLGTAGGLVLVACGTSYHAALLGAAYLRNWARVRVTVEVASEWRFSDPALAPGDVVVGVTQSGETRDTLAALDLARQLGQATAAITNVEGSQVCSQADLVFHTHAGLEIGVAATKTFTCQAALFASLAIQLGRARGTITDDAADLLTAELAALPGLATDSITRSRFAAERFARRWAESPLFFYVARNLGFPLALEGALKMKEISYAPSDAYPAGEMKHGPIALLSPDTPTIAIAVGTPVPEKLRSNVSEIIARGAPVLAIASDGEPTILQHSETAILLPRCDWRLQPILASIPLQLLALHVAERRGLNVDQPRNLAKTVTVE